LKKKQPKRREGQQYWSEQQFQQLINAPSADLASRGPLPWRLLVYMLDASPDVARIRKLVAGRLLAPKEQISAQKRLNQQLVTLWRGGYLTLDPKPPLAELDEGKSVESEVAGETEVEQEPASAMTLDLGQRRSAPDPQPVEQASKKNREAADTGSREVEYQPDTATPTEKMADLLKLRGVHPLYALFLMNHLGIADTNERIMAFESILQLSRSLGKAIRIPRPDVLPPGPLATTRLDSQLLKLGLATAEELGSREQDEDEDKKRGWYDEDDYVPVLSLPHKLQRLFQHDFPGVHDVRITPVWVVGELLQYGTDFNKYITSHKLQKQEGVIFRHLLRFILLIDEMAELCPADVEQDVWREDLFAVADQLEEICRLTDPSSTDQWLADTREDSEKSKEPNS
ncbi:DUF3516 domain-containing protein, partial [Mariniblastus sp.]|nr:DUF3516 domain-containing protein [Mariniblastus sp.]